MKKSKRLSEFWKKIFRMSRPDIQIAQRSSRGLSFNSSEFSSDRSQRSWGTSHSSCESVTIDYDIDCEDECWSSLPLDVHAGCLPVYVGKERRRFVIPTSYLSNNIFRALLAKSEEEYGFRCVGGLRIACSPDAFEHFLWWLEGEATCCLEDMKHTSSGRSG